MRMRCVQQMGTHGRVCVCVGRGRTWALLRRGSLSSSQQALVHWKPTRSPMCSGMPSEARLISFQESAPPSVPAGQALVPQR